MARLTSINNTILGAVYDELKKNIISLHLAPGTVISTQEIATKLNVSRTPVREAFLRLQSEDLVETIPQKETIVSRINLKRVEQERFLREALEAAAIPYFLKNCTDDVLMNLRKNIRYQKDCCDRKDYVGFIKQDNEFHRLIFEAASQQLSWNVIMNNNGHYNRIRVLTIQNEETLEGSVRQHEQMIDMMERGQEVELCAEFKDHVRKLNEEKTDLIRKYADYFSDGETPTHGITIGTL